MKSILPVQKELLRQQINLTLLILALKSIRNTAPLLDSYYTYDSGPNKPPTTFVFGPFFLASNVYQLSPSEVTTSLIMHKLYR